MSAIHATQQLIAAYDDRGAWDTGHESAQARFDVEQKMAWGIRLFQGLLGLEGAMQARAMQEPSPELMDGLELMPPLYRRWLQVSTFYLERARELSSGRYTIDGLGDFRLAVEEAQCLLDAIDFEPRIRPIEELIPMARPNNPRPARYKD